MIAASRRRRGEPLLALALVLMLWIAGRIGFILPGELEARTSSVVAGVPAGAQAAGPALSTAASMPAAWPSIAGSRSAGSPGANRLVLKEPVAAPPPRPALAYAQEEQPQESRPEAALPAAVAPPPFAALADKPVAAQSRWSADGWILVRRSGGPGLGAGLAPATYGASQAGLVLRYRLIPGSGHRAAAYLRASRSLDGPSQREAAAGLSVRPVAAIPVVAAGEVRVVRDAFGTRIRPVALAISEFRPVELPGALRGEAYVQAGYAGGGGATAFADGQLRVDRSAHKAGRTDLRLGAGAWGGAQKGASRLDAGPTLSATAPLGDRVFARASVDWRFRIAGDAAPASGPALTVSAGF